MVEIWKDVAGFENMYAVSNFGRVKSKSRKVWNHTGYWVRPEKILKPQISDRGYLKVRIGMNETKCTRRVHRLVAEAFIPKPNDTYEVNHIDGNKLNNRVDNLEWVSKSDNLKHAVKLGLIIPPSRKKCC